MRRWKKSSTPRRALRTTTMGHSYGLRRPCRLIQRTLTCLRRRRPHCDFCIPCSVRRTKIGAGRGTSTLIWNGWPRRRMRLTHLRDPICMTLPISKSSLPPKARPRSRLLLLPLHRETPIPIPYSHQHQRQLSSKTCLHPVKKKVSESHLAMLGVVQLHSPHSFNPSLGFSLIGHLNLDSELELDLDLDLGLDEPVTGVPISNPITTTRPAAIPAPTRQQPKTNSLDTTLPFFFPQKTSKGGGGLARTAKVNFNFARTEDETQIRARWEAARGELTREWKRRHREAVKSRRRRGGGRGERVE
jgi:hypothetical protein